MRKRVPIWLERQQVPLGPARSMAIIRDPRYLASCRQADREWKQPVPRPDHSDGMVGPCGLEPQTSTVSI